MSILRGGRGSRAGTSSDVGMDWDCLKKIMGANGESRESHRKARALQGECQMSPAAPSGAVSLPVIHQLGKTEAKVIRGKRSGL